MRQVFQINPLISLVFAAAVGLLLAGCAAAPAANSLDASLTTVGVSPEASAIVIVRLEDERVWTSGGPRIDERFVVASTSKIPHTLIALETGAVSGPDEVFEWDGEVRFLPAWNKDQSLADAFRNSTVWIYQAITPRVGSDALQGWLEAFGYGNADVGDPEQVTRYWLEGPLKASAAEQAGFLARLARHTLPLSARTYALAEPIMLAEAGGDWRLYQKTGWYSSDSDQDIGWCVGWLDQTGGAMPGTYVFAFNMDMNDPDADIPRRAGAVRQALSDIGALPTPENGG